MFKKFLIFTLVVLLAGPLFMTCKKEEDEEPVPPPPTTGTVKGQISDINTGDSLSDVRIILFNANTNEPTGLVSTTNTDGKYSFTVAGGNYFLKLTSQGYNDIPARGTSGLPFTVTNGQTTENNIEMYPNDDTNIGWIVGKLISDDASLSSCLVVAVNGNNGYSTISDSEGNFIIYNVPTATYDLKAWKAGINSTNQSAMVATDTGTDTLELDISSSTGSTVSGSITFLATSNIEVDVALTHPKTEETIPGLNTMTSGGSYSISNVSDGDYLARATYANDEKVMDPDWIVKNGEPMVSVQGGNKTRDFSVTGCVELVSPNNDASSAIPVPTDATPTFSWTKYSSTSDYVIEVSTANGDIIWGGFNSDWTVKNITIPSSESSIVFNSDGNATENLKVGNVYRWKIYSSKDDSQSATKWKLISVSEDQRGLIVIE